MAFVPAGSFRAGTPSDRVPRIADEEMPGTSVEMGGFYIDLLPWPNEPNAIPTTNVSREEAELLCEGKGKRLCTELEWERACKGPSSSAYEYGDTYRKDVCGTGLAPEQAARRPTGEFAQCKSGFGAMEMHGGVFEWTSSAWGRGSRDASQGVLRGGNSPAGELAGRCANAIARAPSKRAPTMGFRCCAGTRNTSEVALELVGTPGLSLRTNAEPWADALAVGPVDRTSLHAWKWVPVSNEELTVVTGCSASPRTCGLLVARGNALASISTGKDPPEVVRNGDARHLRIRYVESAGVVARDLTYAFGRVDVSEARRP